MNPTNELAVRPAGEMSSLPPAAELESAWKLAQALVTTRFLPSAIDTPAKAVAIWLKGRELGLPFMLSMSSIHIIEGKPTASAELMRSLAFQRVRGFGMKVVQADDKACEIEFRREGSEPFTYRYAIEDAMRAGDASKNTYRKHPGPMLVARCTAQGLRLYCPDATMGVYAPEEFDEPASPSKPEPAPIREVPAEVEAPSKEQERPEGEAVAAGVGPTGTRAPQQPDTPAQAASSTGATLDYATMFRETMEAHYRVKFRGPGAGERLTRAVNAVAQQAGLPIKAESWKDCSPADWQSLALAAKAYVDSKRVESGTDAAVTDGAPPAASNRWHENTPVEAETALAEAATRAMNATLEEAAEADKALADANLAAKRAARRAMYASPEGFLKACEEAERKLLKANISHQFVFPVGGVPYFIDGDILDICGMTSQSGIDIETLTDDERILLRDEVEKFVARRLA